MISRRHFIGRGVNDHSFVLLLLLGTGSTILSLILCSIIQKESSSLPFLGECSTNGVGPLRLRHAGGEDRDIGGRKPETGESG